MQLGATLLCALLALVSLISHVAGNTKSQEKLLAEAQKAPNGILELDESTYDRLLAAPRDFSVTVLYTALHPRYRCAACNLFKEPYEQVALGWQKKKSTKRHVFAKVEADRAMEVLKRNKFTHVPVIYNFPAAPSSIADEPSEYDVSRQGFSADDFADVISEFLQVPVTPKKPLVTKATLIQLFLGGAVILATAFVVPRIDFRNSTRAVMMLISLGLIFTFTSGYMWNRIRNPPFMMAKPNGDAEIFSEGFQSQNGVESPILIALYAGIAVSALVLNNVAPYIRSGPLQLLVVLAGVAGLLLGFSYLMEIFRRKNPIYPFHLFI